MASESSPLLGASINDDVPEVAPKANTMTPPVKPFLFMVALLGVIMGVLVALSVFVGGCASLPEECYKAALEYPKNYTTNEAWITISPNAQQFAKVRLLLEQDPAFLVPTLVQQQLLGAERLFVLPAPHNASATAYHQPHTVGNAAGNATFNVNQPVYWVTAGQVLGQYARTGFECGCNRANRTTLGAARLQLTAHNGTTQVDVLGGSAAHDLTNSTMLSSFFNLPTSTAVRAQPTAAWRGAAHDYLFVDVLSQTKEQSKPERLVTALAYGDLAQPPLQLQLHQANDSAGWSLRPTAVTGDGGARVYFYYGTPDAPMLAMVENESELLRAAPAVQYFVSTSLANATDAVWSSDPAQAQALPFGCQIVSLMAQHALCLTASRVSGNSTVNDVQLLEIRSPWTVEYDPVTILQSPADAVFVDAEWHPESLTTSGANTSVFVSVISDTFAQLPHFFQLQAQAQ